MLRFYSLLLISDLTFHMTYILIFFRISFWECLEWICMQELQVSGPKLKCKAAYDHQLLIHSGCLSSLPWTEKRVYYNYYFWDKDVFTYMIVFVWISLKLNISPLKLKAKDNKKKKRNNERNEAICGCVCDTNYICNYVSTLKSCIWSWHQQFHLCVL